MAFKIYLPICATLIFSGLAATLAAQDTASIPGARGVYYHADSGWLGLTGTVLMPMIAGTTADFFSVGPKQAVAGSAGAAWGSSNHQRASDPLRSRIPH